MRRLRFQFTLAQLFGVISVVAIGLGIVAGERNRVIREWEQENEIREHIEKHSGRVVFNAHMDEHWAARVSWIQWNWLRDLFGQNYFSRIGIVDLSETDVTSEQLAQLRLENLKNLTALHLRHCQAVRDDALPALKRLHGLKILNVSHSGMSWDAASELKALPNIQVLSAVGVN